MSTPNVRDLEIALKSGADANLLKTALDNAEAINAIDAAEAAFLSGAVAGTQAASKVIVNDANANQGVAKVTALHIGTSGSETQVGATAAELNAAADVSARLVSITDADTPITVANSGKPHVIADVSADRTFTLPTPASGLEYAFYPKLNAADGHDWIFTTGSNTNYIVGGVQFLDTDAGAGADEISLVVGNGSSNSKFQVNLPQPGTLIRFICDGTLWVLSGVVCSTTAPAFADQ
jgi:hypothetical protein